MEGTSSSYQKMLTTYYNNSDIAFQGPPQLVMPTIDNVPVWIKSEINNPDGSRYIDVDFWKNEMGTPDFKDKLAVEIKAWTIEFYRKANEKYELLERKKQDDFMKAFSNADWFKRVYNGDCDFGLIEREYPNGEPVIEIPATIVSLPQTGPEDQDVIVKINGVVQKRQLSSLMPVIVPRGTGISSNDARSANLKKRVLNHSVNNWSYIVEFRLSYIITRLMRLYPNKKYNALTKGQLKIVLKDLMNDYLNANYGVLNKNGDGYLVDRFPTSDVFTEWIMSKNKAEAVKPKLTFFDKLFSRKPRMSETKFGGKPKTTRKNRKTKKTRASKATKSRK
jgi:hypothetical protein